ncbi:MAG TPA: hypothetical protein PK941_10360 [Paludibacter sp.]|nr:hypothetical protein [Paludibacter sp.]
MTHNKVTLINQYWNALFRQKQSWFTSLIVIFFVAFFVVLLIIKSKFDFKLGEESFYVDALEPVITIGTFVIAAILGVQNVKNTWIDKLPKKLTVHFKYEDKYVYTCHKAYLSGESDIRQMAQQIGRQMNNNINLDFYPYMQLNSPTIEHNIQNKSSNTKYCFKHYEVTFFLSNHVKNEYIVWWDNDPEKPGNSVLTTEKSSRVVSEMEAERLLEKTK